MAQSDTLTRPDVDLEAMFAHEIPCEKCSKPAALRSMGHIVNDCGPDSPGGVYPPYYRCIDCYSKWLIGVISIISKHGRIRCENCQRTFTTPAEFSNYREF